MKTAILSLPIALLLSATSYGAVMCPGKAVNDLSAPGGSLYPLRITHQGALGICHIEQLHKLLQAKMDGHPDLSRFQMAMVEKRVRDQALSSSQKKAVRWWANGGKNPGGIYIDAGTSCEAYELIKGQNVCEASNDRLEQLVPEDQMLPSAILNNLSAYFDKRVKLPFPLQMDAINQAAAPCDGNIPCVLNRFSQEAPIDPTDPIVSVFFNNFVVGSLSSLNLGVDGVSSLIATEDRDEFFSKAAGSCDKDKLVVPDSLSCQYDDLQDRYKVAANFDDYATTASAQIDSMIEEGTPVGISICTRMFTTKDAVTIRVGTGLFTCGDKTDPGYKSGEGSHAVAIIGSRCQNGTREYLVQNSWGSSCKYYDASYTCTGKGGVWIPADIVLKNTRNLQYFE